MAWSGVIAEKKKFASGQIINAIAGNDKESRKCWLIWLLTSEKATGKEAASHRFRQPDNHPEFCFSLPFMWQKLACIHNNPVHAGMARKAEDYDIQRRGKLLLWQADGTSEDGIAECNGDNGMRICIGRSETCIILTPAL